MTPATATTWVAEIELFSIPATQTTLQKYVNNIHFPVETTSRRPQRPKILKRLKFYPTIQFIEPRFRKTKMANRLKFSNGRFMEEVQKYDCLYNKYSKEFKDRSKKDNAWKEVAADLRI